MKVKKQYLYTDISGNDIHYLTYEYGQGAETLYIQGGIHGGEVTYFIFHKIHTFLKKYEKKLKGKVMLAPIINPTAWNQRIYYYTLGKFDFYKGADWNRSYPGGETTLSARNSKIIFQKALPYKYLIDLHTARVSKPYTIYTNESLRPIVKKFGLAYNQFININEARYAKYKGIFPPPMLDKGRTAFICECGSHDSRDQSSIDTVYDGLLRLIADFDLISELKMSDSDTYAQVFEKIDVIYSPESGFTQYHIKPHEIFKKGDILCTIHSSSSLEKTIPVRAPFDGILFELPRSHIVWVGDELFRVIKKEEVKRL